MSFYKDFLIHSPLFTSTNRVSSLDYLEPITRALIQDILEDAATQGTPLLVFETFRSQKRQEILFAQKATQLEKVGVHGYGLACDLVKNIGGQPSWKGDFTFLGVLAKKHGLVWGGDFHGFVDSCHVQRVSVSDQSKLFANEWYPDSSYLPFKKTAVA